MDVSIAIVSWKVKNELNKCLQSIFNNTSDIEFEVFVVDNKSDDGTVEMVSELFPQVYLIKNEINLGFAKACNQAIRKSKGDYVLLLNPDSVVKKNTIKDTLEFMSHNQKCGIAGCKIINEDGSIQPSVRRFPDLASHIIILLKLHNLLGIKAVNNYYFNDFDYNKVSNVDQIMGAFFMIRKKMLEQIGLLDENFYIWYEEVDLCYRAKQKDWKILYYPNVSIIHQKGLSFSQVNPLKKQCIFNRSMLYYFFKHKNFLQYFILLILYPISMILTLFIALFKIKKIRKDL